MGAHHYLEHGFNMIDYKDDHIFHGLELYETGGELFVRVWVGGESANNPVIGKITIQQARQLADGAEALASRLRG